MVLELINDGQTNDGQFVSYDDISINESEMNIQSRFFVLYYKVGDVFRIMDNDNLILSVIRCKQRLKEGRIVAPMGRKFELFF